MTEIKIDTNMTDEKRVAIAKRISGIRGKMLEVAQLSSNHSVHEIEKHYLDQAALDIATLVGGWENAEKLGLL